MKKIYFAVLLIFCNILYVFAQKSTTIFRDTIRTELPENFGREKHSFGFPFGYKYLYKSTYTNFFTHRIEEITLIIRNTGISEKDLVLEFINPFVKVKDISHTVSLRKDVKEYLLNDTWGITIPAGVSDTIRLQVEKGVSPNDPYKIFLWDRSTFVMQSKANVASLSILFFSLVTITVFLFLYVFFKGSQRSIFGWFGIHLLLVLIMMCIHTGIFKPLYKNSTWISFGGESVYWLLYGIGIILGAKSYPRYLYPSLNKSFNYIAIFLPILLLLSLLQVLFTKEHQINIYYLIFVTSMVAFIEIFTTTWMLYHWREINIRTAKGIFTFIAIFKFVGDFFTRNLQVLGIYFIPKFLEEYYFIMPNSFQIPRVVLYVTFIESVFIFLTIIYQTWYVERGEALMSIAKEKENNYLKYIEGVEYERQRIADNLHNSFQIYMSSVMDKMATIKTYLNAGEYQKCEQTLAEATTQIEHTKKQLRNLMKNLDTREVMMYGLIKSIESMQTMFENTPLKVSFNYNDELEDISKTVQILMYRMVQIAFHNVKEHSNAKNVYIQLLRDNPRKTIYITIEDDGNGFDPENYVEGFGLRNIRETVKMLNGSLDIESTREKGTILLISLQV